VTFGHTWLYVIEHEHGYYKIGHSDSPWRRASQLQVGSPYEVELWLMARFLDAEFGDNTPDFEERLHDRFDSGHVRGEWFEADRNDIYHFLAREAEDESGDVTRLVHYPREFEKKQEMKKANIGSYRGPLSSI